MTEEEARAIMKSHGWTFTINKSRHGTKYLYARRRQKYTRLVQYICPLSRLNELTEAELVSKLPPVLSSTPEPSSVGREPEVADTTDPLTPTDE